MQRTTIALDVHKSIFEIAVSQVPGRVESRQRVKRGRLLEYFAQQPAATVVMEACGSSHYWGRQLRDMGHDPVLLPPGEVRRYVRRQKTDKRDAKGLLEAHRNEEITCVPIKTVDQQMMASLHRLREGWKKTRTGRINQVRGILRELGIVIPVGSVKVVTRVRELLGEPCQQIPEGLRPSLEEACSEICELKRKADGVELQLKALAKQTPRIQHLMSIPGIGVLTATALVAIVGDLKRFRTGRHLASFLGLTPREHQSGSRRHLGGISKQGDRYLRTLLIHGGRSLLLAAKRKPGEDRLRHWALRIEDRRGYNKAAVAVANKLARIAWAVACENRCYRTLSV